MVIGVYTICMTYIYALLISLALDGLWLGLISKAFYKKHIGYLMTENPKLIFAGIFYLILSLAIVMLIINPALAQQFSTLKVFAYGCLLGLVIYAGYDMTNQAIIKDWPLIVTIVDLAWGTLMTGLVALFTWLIVS